MCYETLLSLLFMLCYKTKTWIYSFIVCNIRYTKTGVCCVTIIYHIPILHVLCNTIQNKQTTFSLFIVV
jgi:hypothetical protein